MSAIQRRNRQAVVITLKHSSEPLSLWDLVELTGLSETTLRKTLKLVVDNELAGRVKSGKKWMYYWADKRKVKYHANDFDPTNPIPTSYHCW